jgi:hypothetical protein
MKQRLIRLVTNFPFARRILLKLFPSSSLLNRQVLQQNFLRDYIYSHYEEESLKQKRFYNIGAGFQRSKFPIWSYVDLKGSGYDEKGIDVFYDLESITPIPLQDNMAEVVFSSFVIEHISVAATHNLCREAYRVLKSGGVFHSKIHSYEYGYLLWKNNLISPMVPFGGRESQAMVDAFIKRHKGKIRGFFDRSRGYVLQSLKNPEAVMTFSTSDFFLLHNATTAYERIRKDGGDSKNILDSLPGDDIKDFFDVLRRDYVDQHSRRPHQHNADFISQEDLLAYIRSIGFSKVYFTQPYQSVAPVLWEEALNPIHQGFVYAIEAVK